NAMTVGLADQDKIFYCAAAGIGNPVVYVGSKTGRDGIHGATMASTEFTEDSEAKRPTVQVGDPFTEKLLIEACLELMNTDAIIAIQDMGAAGLTSSSVEMASKGGVGFELNLDNVPQRETNMTPYEMCLSESQERMLMVLKPGREDMAKAIFEKWELDFAVIGEITDTGKLTLTFGGDVVGDMPIDSLVEDAPEYERPYEFKEKRDIVDVDAPADLNKAVMDLIGSEHLCSRRWIWEQYDSMVLADTIQRPGGDAAVVRVHGTEKALAISTDVTPRYCYADPEQGGRQAVAETWRNITAVGAKPLAITNCLNFGNPERTDIMGQFVGCLKGMGDACRALDYPIVSGNVSLYNETNGSGILPTPAIGGVGVMANSEKMATIAFKGAEQTILLIGETKNELGASLYQNQLIGEASKEIGAPPFVDLNIERRNGDFIRLLIENDQISTCHDLSDGGLIAGLADMAMAGRIGASVKVEADLPLHVSLFSESQARYLVAADAEMAETVRKEAKDAGIPVAVLGTTGGDRLTVNDGKVDIALAALTEAHEGWLPSYMAGDS
ncbi:MAG: phosphoribosylformylglycinamidine synthase subunit PurL, partial [Kordiimonadaceae bacterium]|nr:phosphoribosylformylglycinamidine synthase subunit PurL [Kordiimonadaceae bacterium]